MTSIDYIIITIALVSAAAGAWRGLLREAIAVLTWVIAVFVAWHFSDVLEPYMGGALASETVRPWAARTVLFLAILVTGTIVGSVVGHFVRLSLFSGMDRLLGFVFGLIRGAMILGMLAIISHAVRLDGETWWQRSTLVPYAEGAGNVLRALAGEGTVTIRRLTTS